MTAKYKSHVEPYMDLIKSMRIDGFKEEDIADKLDIGHSTWYKYKTLHIELVEALKISKEILISSLEQTLFQKALEGNPTLLIFALKNLAPQKWGEKIDINASIKAGEFNEAIKRFIDKI